MLHLDWIEFIKTSAFGTLTRRGYIFVLNYIYDYNDLCGWGGGGVTISKIIFKKLLFVMVCGRSLDIAFGGQGLETSLGAEQIIKL